MNESIFADDDSLVQLLASPSSDAIVDVSGPSSNYINASKIFDSDPEPAYIATQAPQANTVAQFWQMVWEQGVALVSWGKGLGQVGHLAFGQLVNLCDQEETKSGRYAQYWPEEGSRLFGTFEVHLVSEHIWSEVSTVLRARPNNLT